MYKKYLSNAKECINGSECYYAGMIKNLDGTNERNYDYFTSPKLILNDGTLIMFELSSKSCSSYSEAPYGIYSYCALMFVDINGAKKPNTWGRDNFQFLLTEAGLKPRGCGITNPGYCTYGNGQGAGHACACKVLHENAMNY